MSSHVLTELAGMELSWDGLLLMAALGLTIGIILRTCKLEDEE